MKSNWKRTPASIDADENFSQKIKSRLKPKKIFIPYKDQLKSKEWQDKRDKILARDGYKCQGKNCDHFLDGENPPLSVHHIYYEDGKHAWEYPDYALISLCNECHSIETELSDPDNLRLKHALAKRKFLAQDVIALCEMIEDGFFDGVKNG